MPKLNSFVEGLVALLKPDGVLTVEFPHLRNLLAFNQFDTIYHEHWSYFWITTAKRASIEAPRPATLRREGNRHARRQRAALLLPRHVLRPTSSNVAERGRADSRWTPPPASTTTRRTTPSRSVSARPSGRCWSSSSTPSVTERPNRRLWRARQRQHAAELLRHRHATSLTSPSTATRRSRGTSSPAAASRFLPPGRDRRGAAGLRVDSPLEPHRTKSSVRWRTSASGAADSSSPSQKLPSYDNARHPTKTDIRPPRRSEGKDSQSRRRRRLEGRRRRLRVHARRACKRRASEDGRRTTAHHRRGGGSSATT